jgi:GTP-binding protein HflX
MADADLLLHVIDASDPDRDQQVATVDALLVELGLAEKPRLVVWNKADRLQTADAETLMRDGFVVSALDRATFGPLLLAIARELWREGKGEALGRVGAGVG